MATAVGKWIEGLHEMRATLVMIFVQFVLAIANVFYKVAADDGMDLSVLVAYRFCFGSAFVLPLAFFLERDKWGKMTTKTAFYGFLSGLFGGSLGQNLYMKSLYLTSSVTFVTAISNLIPAITFIVAVTAGLEKVAWNTPSGMAKILGTCVGIGGATILTFYKGPILHTNVSLMKTRHRPSPGGGGGGGDFVAGAALGIVACVCYGVWFVVQAKLCEGFPWPYTSNAMMNCWAAIQGGVFGVCVERDWRRWRLGWNVRLLVVSFAGVVGSGFVFTLMAWCIRMRGPLFVSAFQPLVLVFVSLAGTLFLDDQLRVGIVVGGILIVCGLYMVLWGKGKETTAARNQEEIHAPPHSTTNAGGGSPVPLQIQPKS